MAVIAIRERYVVDENGTRVSVLLDMEDYRRLLEELEELESIRAYDTAKAARDEAIPFEQAVVEIERDRQ
jgi:PHD/YefM family antitoxin component YafN of YafNO toxin-antitoxin module